MTSNKQVEHVSEKPNPSRGSSHYTMFASSYLPHALYSAAIISLSIHLVNQQRTSSDERGRLNAQISVLQSISQQLQSGKPLSRQELERLKRLARPLQLPLESQLKEPIGWKEVIFGQRASDPSGGAQDPKDMQNGAYCLIPRSVTGLTLQKALKAG